MIDGCPEKLLVPEVLEWFGIWRRYRKYGLPFGPKWANENPAVLIELFDLLDSEYDKWAEIDREKRKHGN